MILSSDVCLFLFFFGKTILLTCFGTILELVGSLSLVFLSTVSPCGQHPGAVALQIRSSGILFAGA
jgi:hypothetical protein